MLKSWLTFIFSSCNLIWIYSLLIFLNSSRCFFKSSNMFIRSEEGIKTKLWGCSYSKLNAMYCCCTISGTALVAPLLSYIAFLLFCSLISLSMRFDMTYIFLRISVFLFFFLSCRQFLLSIRLISFSPFCNIYASQYTDFSNIYWFSLLSMSIDI